MEKYKVEFRKSVEKELRAISQKDQIRLLRRIDQLSVDPRPPASKKLSGQERYRVRQGNFRILYEIQDKKLIVTVVKIGNRRDVYK